MSRVEYTILISILHRFNFRLGIALRMGLVDYLEGVKNQLDRSLSLFSRAVSRPNFVDCYLIGRCRWPTN